VIKSDSGYKIQDASWKSMVSRYKKSMVSRYKMQDAGRALCTGRARGTGSTG
jgi:hypothetical protein